MKKLISAVLALSLLGTAAASAQPFGGGYGPGASRDGGWSHQRTDNRDWDSGRFDRNRPNTYYGGAYRGSRHDSRNDGAALIGLGIGLFALAAIASSHQQETDRAYRDRNGYYEGY